MCGIVGVIKAKEKPITKEEYYDFLTMLDRAQNRGRQATGVVFVFENGTVHCCKSPTESSKITDFVPYRKGLRAMLGHTRASTGGPPHINKNNHPHETDHWALIHNGTCSSSLTRKEMDLDTQCDTEEFVGTFEHTERTAAKPSPPLTTIITKSLCKMSGGWSLAFIHKQSGRLFLTTNGKNPLNCFYYKDGFMFASSESYFMELNSYKSEKTDIVSKGNVVIATKVDWKEHQILESFQVFSPVKETLFEVTDSGILTEVGTYSTVPYAYESYKGAASYYERSKNVWSGGTNHNQPYFDDTWGSDAYYAGGYHKDSKSEKRNNVTSTKATPKATNTEKKYNPLAVQKGKQTAKVDPDLLSEGAWQAAYGTENGMIEKAVYDSMIYNFSMQSPTYYAMSEEKYFFDYTQDELRAFAILLLEDEPETFGANFFECIDFCANFSKGSSESPPKHIRKLINKKFNTEVLTAVGKFMDEDNLLYDVPNIVWDVVEDMHTLNDQMYTRFAWWERAIVARFGIEIEDLDGEEHSPPTDSDCFDEHEFDYATAGELLDFSLSRLTCKTCDTARRVIPLETGSVLHLCPVCRSKFIEDQAQNLPVWRN